MTDTLIQAYNLGKRLAFMKYSEMGLSDIPESESTEVDELTKKLEEVIERGSDVSTNRDILDSSERSSNATWGDKMELETNSNTGINV